MKCTKSHGKIGVFHTPYYRNYTKTYHYRDPETVDDCHWDSETKEVMRLCFL
jgi:hypothetical protein